MKKRTIFGLLVSHGVVGAIGFAAGIYALPILIAPPAPEAAVVEQAAKNSDYVGQFIRERKGSDSLHYGEGEFSISADTVSFAGKLTPGPDYKLYFSPEFVETKEDFERLKSSMVQVADIKTFNNFVVPLPSDIDPAKYSAAIVWCETFGAFITSGNYEKK